MYSREFRTEGIPPGYGGNAFNPKEDCKEEKEHPAPTCEEEPPCPPPPPHHEEKRRRDVPPPFHPLFRKWRMPDLGDLFSGDLLLVVVAILLLTGKGEDCEERDDDLWLLLILIYFMK